MVLYLPSIDDLGGALLPNKYSQLAIKWMGGGGRRIWIWIGVIMVKIGAQWTQSLKKKRLFYLYKTSYLLVVTTLSRLIRTLSTNTQDTAQVTRTLENFIVKIVVINLILCITSNHMIDTIMIYDIIYDMIWYNMILYYINIILILYLYYIILYYIILYYIILYLYYIIFIILYYIILHYIVLYYITLHYIILYYIILYYIILYYIILYYMNDWYDMIWYDW